MSEQYVPIKLKGIKKSRKGALLMLGLGICFMAGSFSLLFLPMTRLSFLLFADLLAGGGMLLGVGLGVYIVSRSELKVLKKRKLLSFGPEELVLAVDEKGGQK